MKKHTYTTSILWTGNRGRGTKNYKDYEREYTIQIAGKTDIRGSADASFRGDQSRHNPEELFVASISSCHMLWFLHLCAVSGVTVVDYQDQASGVMTEDEEGGGYFESVTLNPVVVILESDKKELAEDLHHEANKKCFIANSCNFEIGHKPSVSIKLA